MQWLENENGEPVDRFDDGCDQKTQWDNQIADLEWKEGNTATITINDQPALRAYAPGSIISYRRADINVVISDCNGTIAEVNVIQRIGILHIHRPFRAGIPFYWRISVGVSYPSDKRPKRPND